MNKLLAIIKREYLQRVRSKMFIVWTVLGPLMMVFFSVVPALIFNIKAGDATRIAVVDQSGKMYERVRDAVMRERNIEEGATDGTESAAKNINTNSQDRLRDAGESAKGSFKVEQVHLMGRSLDDVRRELNARVLRDELDGYVIIPQDILTGGKATFYGRNTGDVITQEQLRDRLTSAVRDQRMAEKNIAQGVLNEINRPVSMAAIKVSETGEEQDSGKGFVLVLVVGFLIYLTILTYGQVILGAVIEEKETRIAEVLFSSVRSFTLMMGKLIGVSLVALTQYAIWGLAFAMFALYGVSALAARGIDASPPHIQPVLIIYFILFFLLGYFIYATFYLLVGSMVTTAQEGGQMALPVIFLLVIGFYLAFPVIRSPNSSFAFWISMVPFWSPITMLVRIVTHTPPFWQIALSLVIGFATVILLTWLAARIYRIGMLMYGKRASIPEVIRWVRQA
jgi:ABC-2 type transport system permease protein